MDTNKLGNITVEYPEGTYLTIEPTQIVDILGTAGMSVGYWADRMFTDEDTATVSVWELDVESDAEGTHVVTFEHIAKVIVEIAQDKHDYRADRVREFLADLNDPEEARWAAGSIDGEDADVILQVALFGEVVYG